MVGLVQPQSIASKAQNRIFGWGQGRVFVPRDLLDLGSRQSVDVLLHRLVARGTIRNLGRGIYDYPKHHARFGPLTPTTDDIAMAVARSTGENIVQSGATAANVLGLSTQVPARAIYLTDGTSRTVRVGPLNIRLRHAAPSRMVGGDTTAGLVLRALQFLGQGAINDTTLAHLRASLSDVDRKALADLRIHATTWMQPLLAQIASSYSTSIGKKSGRDRSKGRRGRAAAKRR